MVPKYIKKLSFLSLSWLFFSLVFHQTPSAVYAKDGPTLAKVKAYGKLKCGTHSEKLGFSIRTKTDRWIGIDVDMCRAVAAATLGDPEAVEFITTSAQNRFPVLKAGEIDMLTRSTTWTLTRDTEFAVNFAGPFFYDGQGFMVLKELRLKNIYELDGAKVCMPSNTTVPKNVSDFFGRNGLNFQAAFVDNNDFGFFDVFFQGFCDVVVNDISSLASARILRDKTQQYEILPIQISKEPLSAAVRHGDDQWYNIVFWTINAVILAEEYGITSENVDQLLQSDNPKIQYMLGERPGVGKIVGLDDKWIYRIIKNMGNYEQLYRRNIIEKLGLGRGVNRLWKDGGLLYAFPLPHYNQR